MPVNTIICHYLTKRQNDVVSLRLETEIGERKSEIFLLKYQFSPFTFPFDKFFDILIQHKTNFATRSFGFCAFALGALNYSWKPR